MKRSSGILLHITSLPGPFGIGDMGPEAYRFADRLERANQSIWQVLPLVPVGYGNSPYASPSTFAGNNLLISPELLLEDKLISTADLNNLCVDDSSCVDFTEVATVKRRMLDVAFKNFEEGTSRIDRLAFDEFCRDNIYWLADFSLFAAIKEANHDVAWTSWPDQLARRDEKAIEDFRSANRKRIEKSKFWQFLFFRQWHRLKAYCNRRGVQILGDLPIYVAHDSADVWANPNLFLLDHDGQPTVVAGVPPDYFSETGQRWGNPIYNWPLMAERGYTWWILRMRALLNMVDIVRLDHFRGFEAFWAVPSSEPTAVSGTWMQGPGASLFDTFAAAFEGVPSLVAEDLGVITDQVTTLMEQYNFPGMAILQFGFDDGPDGKFLPHNFARNLVAYTGTHDNDTVAGWYLNNNGTQTTELAEKARKYCREYLGVKSPTGKKVSSAMVRALLASVADTAIIPMQDLLGLDSDARMNTPGLTDGNWAWRMQSDAFSDKRARKLAKLTALYGRAREEERREKG